MVEVEGLTKRYGRHTAVDDLSFTVAEGQIYGFLGPNGAGKSTTMNLMTGYLGPTAGEVRVDGHSVVEEPEKAKRAIGYLPEIPPVYPDMTVDVYLFFAASLKGIARGKRAGEVDLALQQVGIEDVQHRLIRNLSKGYRQRLGLAQALLGSPKLLILDEPTVGLDPKQIMEIRTLIRELARERTVLLSSHILSEVQEVCDHILIINHGRKVACGTPGELTALFTDASALLVTVGGGAEQAAQALEPLREGAEVEPLEAETPGESRFRLRARDGGDLREAVFRCCVRGEVPLLGMGYHTVSLEEAFLRLTDDESGTPSQDTGKGEEA